MRPVTAKPPKMLMLAITTAARPSHFELAEPAAALAISAPTMMTDEIALVTLIRGVCSAGVTDQTPKLPTRAFSPIPPPGLTRAKGPTFAPDLPVPPSRSRHDVH